MSLLERLRRIVRANILDGLERIENPERVLDQRIHEMENAVRSARQAVSNFAMTLMKLEKEQRYLENRVAHWRRKAETALQQGDESAARHALVEKRKTEAQAAARRSVLMENRQTFEDLKQSLSDLQDKLQAARLKQSELRTRREAATARRAFGTHLDQARTVADDAFERMEEYTFQAEAEADIDQTIRRNLAGLDEKLEKQAFDSDVDDELETLKKQLTGPDHTPNET